MGREEERKGGREEEVRGRRKLRRNEWKEVGMKKSRRGGREEERKVNGEGGGMVRW